MYNEGEKEVIFPPALIFGSIISPSSSRKRFARSFDIHAFPRTPSKRFPNHSEPDENIGHQYCDAHWPWLDEDHSCRRIYPAFPMTRGQRVKR